MKLPFRKETFDIILRLKQHIWPDNEAMVVKDIEFESQRNFMICKSNGENLKKKSGLRLYRNENIQF